MNLVRHAKHLTVVVAALAGLSLSTAYAVPQYVPPANTPLDVTSLDSESTLLDNFNGYLSAIQAQLPPGKTLALPDGPAAGAPDAPLDADFYAAVAAAVAANEINAEAIVSAAIQYKPGKVKDIVKNVVLTTPTAAPEAVAAATRAVPLKAGDAAAGAILALITAAGGSPLDADLAAAADEAFINQTRELIEKVAKSAVAATKTSTTQSASALAVAETLMDSYLADAAALNSNSELFLDDIARGAIAGVHGFANISKSTVASTLISKFSTATTATKDQVVNFAMGALKASLFVVGTSGYEDVKTALVSGATALGGSLDGVEAGIEAGSKAQKALRSAGGVDLPGVFSANLTATEAANVPAYLSGAVQAFKSKAGDFTRLALEDADVGILSVADRQAVVAAAVTGNFAATSKVVTNSIVNASATNKLTPSEAVAAAIPAASDLYSGLATLAAMKTIPAINPAADSQAVLSTALNAANSAGYERAFGDVALNAAKAKKIFDNELVATAIATVPNGWEEAVAAFIIANNPKDKAELATSLTNEDAANAAAIAKAGADAAGVALAVNIVQAGKLSPKTLFDDAIEAAYANSTKPRAILFGAGAVNAKFTAPLLGMLLRLKTGGDVDTVLRNYAISLNKKGKLNIELAYEAAVDALNYPDNIFDLVDHKILTNQKYAVDILSAVVAARPEYAHYAARAAAFRAPGSVGKTAAAAIQFAHMRSNRDTAGVAITSPDDPAAVAAISAAVVLGVKDAKLATSIKEGAAIKSAVSGLVKAAFAFQNPSFVVADVDKKNGLVGANADFAEATGTSSDPAAPGSTTLRRSKGTAAVLTGAVAQLQVDDAATPGTNELTSLNALAKIAITAAAKAVKGHALAFAQAAGAAAAAAAAGGSVAFTDFAGIVDAFAGIIGLPTPAALENAARLGANQYALGVFGSGAAGILNYSHRSGTGSPVTDISSF